MLCTLLFQMMAGGFEWNAECLDAVENVVRNVDSWAKYRIARSAARYGHHVIATEIFKSLKEAVASEQLHFWLSGLELVTKAECFLTYVYHLFCPMSILALFYISSCFPRDNIHIKCTNWRPKESE